MIYARAPPAFQARYFPPIQPRANSPLGTLNPNLNLSSSSTYLSSSSLQIPSSSSSNLHHHSSNGSSNGNGIPSSWSNTKRALSQTPSQVSLTSNFSSASTIRPPLRLRVGVTPQMFKAELEWLYTGEGMGEVVEWLNDREGRAPGGGGGGGLGLGLGLDGDGGEWGKIEGPGGVGSKTERLRNDLVYMWRSKLYSDVKIILPLSSTRDPSAPLDTVSDDPSSSATTATFSTHKFILASRSPYFAQLLLNSGGFKSRGDLISRDGGEIELPSPPFTPASLHFCLGFMYAGTLSFSNRSFDLQTAFQIHRSATYLQLSSLRSEVEARIVHEFCDSLPLPNTHSSSLNSTSLTNNGTNNGSSYSLSSQQTHPPPSKLTASRVPRVWRFASAPDVAAKDLELRTREWIVLHWGECWGREVGEVGKRERDSLVKDVLSSLHPSTVVSFVRSIGAVRTRVELDVRNGGAGGGDGSGLPATRGLKQSAWVDNLLGMVWEIETRVRVVLGGRFGEVVRGGEFAGLVEGRGFERELLVKVVEDAVAVVGTVEGCKDGGRVYEALVGLLVQVQEETSEPTLAIGSDNRRLVESAAAETMKHIRRRWLQVREKGGFVGLPSYILKEISDGVDQPEEELLIPPLNNQAATRAAPRLSSSVSRSRLANDDASSLRSTILTRNAAKGSDQGKDSDSVSVASRMSTTSRASVASRSSTVSRASVASNASSVVTPLKSSLASKPPIPRAPSFGGSSTASSSSRTPVPTLSKSTSVAALNPPPPRSSAALTSRASTSSLASTSSRQSISRSTPLSSSPVPSPAGTSSSESGRKRTITSSQTQPSSRPPSVASSVRSTASTLRKALTTIPSPSTPVPKLPAIKSPIPPRPRTTSAMSTTSTRSVAASTKSTAPPPIKTSTPPLPALPASPPAKVHRRPPAAASAMSRSSVKATPPPAPPLESSAASTTSTRTRVLSSASRMSTKTSSPDLKSAANSATPTVSKPLRRPSSVASIRSTTNGASPSSSSTKKAPPPPLPTSISTPNPTPTKPSINVPTLNVPSTIAPRKPRSSSTASSQQPHATPHTTPSRTNLELPPSRSSPSAPSSPTTQTHNRPSRFHPATAFDPPKRPPPVRKVPSLPTFVVHSLGSSLPILPSPGVTLIVGIPCIISITGGSTKRGRCRAFARYIGQLQGETGPWIGVELSSDAFGSGADSGVGEVKGLNDGSFGGVRYFDIAGAEEWEEEGGRETKMRKMSSSSRSEDGWSGGGGGLFGGIWGGGKKRDAGESALGEGSDLNKRIRSHSPNSNGGGERTTRGLFLRPNAVVWVEGAE